ncbi:response regulator transcription factor [Streptomyces sp. NPDC101234]|uniref:response regulator transcription factor n=1 Tax=Streptomyces sp. NPDC101234 TaxID=3366138 RepID=UPI00382B3832
MRGNLEVQSAPSRTGGRDVLIVGHDATETDLLTTTLELAGYRVAGTAGTGFEGIEQLTRRPFDLVVWDATLPDLKEVARGRRIPPEDRPPLLYLITCEYLHTLLPVLGRGREDYVTKPVRAAEVLARAQILLRGRHSAGEAGEAVYGDLVLDAVGCQARRGSRALRLSPAEYRLLRHLLANAERVLSKEQISRHVWGEFRASEAIEKLVSRLRLKVDREEPALIHTHRGFGYRLGRTRH